MPKKVTIFGAGISGLVAAINLKKLGFDVNIREKRDLIGGSAEWHPSVHQQNFDLDRTSQYIGIDIHPCFRQVTTHKILFYDKVKTFRNPRQSYICEKGPQSSSIEHHLYRHAVACGVKFIFGETFDRVNISSPEVGDHPFIVATGLEKKPYVDLNIKHSVIRGYGASGLAAGEAFINSYMGNYTHHEFAYSASSGNLIFALLFSRKGLRKADLQAFRDHLQECDNIVLSDWRYSKGCIPLETNLVKNGVVLAGTISGMIDPFYLNGISAALISGKIAALYFTDRVKAYREFQKYTRYFLIKQRLQSISYWLPIKKYSFPLIAALNSKLKWVGVI